MRMGLVMVMAVALIAGGAVSAQPKHVDGQGQHGHGKGQPQGNSHGKGQARGKDQASDKGANRGQPGRGGGPARIADVDRGLIEAYFGQQMARGNCPPGLARKGNGCQPPGQARGWAVGQRLPVGMGYPLPPDLLHRLALPAGHTYMRVGSDILMIATGTGLVVAGLQDLLR